MTKQYWLWFPGDFEIHQGMLQNFTREERGMHWPAYWYIEDSYKNVKFEKSYNLDHETTFTVHTYQQGYITINEKKYHVNEPITLPAGKYDIVIYIFSATELPAIFIEGTDIVSDPSWIADNYIIKRPVGYSNLFTKVKDNPSKIPYEHKVVKPRSFEKQNGGLLIDFGTEINATLTVKNVESPITICYGESKTEALDTINCYYQQSGITEKTKIPKRAFRYLFIPDYNQEKIDISATSEFLPFKNYSEFDSDDNTLNKIWNASITTFKLCSDLFFIDGIKRDRWIWGGDAYQDNFINQYSFFNEDLDKRTIIALRGHDEVKEHINTIVDYSLLWVISIANHYQMSGDKEFMKMIMPRMEKMMDYRLAQTDEHGFIYGRKDDWIFVDWSPMDKEGTVAAEQMFLLQALKSMILAKNVIGEEADKYQKLFDRLKENVQKYFWSDEKGCFIDSYQSGKQNVTRHANILAILFDLVDEEKQQKILKNILLNDKITQLTTPYFKFFEQDALCKLGQLDQVFDTIKSYWGGMIDRGATTIWEEFDPKVTGKDQYAMYGDPFGKSLCHAWGASPVYLLGRYFIGLRPTAPGYKTFEIRPQLEKFQDLHCVLPVKDGTITIDKNADQLRIKSSRLGGKAIYKGKEIELPENQTVTI